MRIEAGFGTVITPAQSIYEQSATQKHRIGERFAPGDGRVFHYCYAGGALAAGKLSIAAAHTANHHNMTVATTAAGSKTVAMTLGATAATLDMYKDGLLLIIAGTGLGQTLEVASNPAADASASLTVTLKNELPVATAVGDSKGDLIPNIFRGVTQSATEENLHVGVPLIAVTSAYYAWVQTWGMCAVLSGDTAAAGTMLNADSAAGERKTVAQYTMDYIGTAYGEAAADGEYNAAYLRLVP